MSQGTLSTEELIAMIIERDRHKERPIFDVSDADATNNHKGETMSTTEAPAKNELMNTPDAIAILKKFEITVDQIAEAVELANQAIVDGPGDTEGMKLAHDYRMGLVKMRTTIDKTRAAEKKDLIAKGKLIEAVAGYLSAPLPAAEARLKELEDTAKREQERLAEIAKQERATEMQRRNSLLYAIGEVLPERELQFLDADEFEKLYAEMKTAYDKRKQEEAEAEQARKAEAERLAKQAEEQAQRQRDIEAKEAAIAKQQAEQQAALDRQQAEIDAKQKAIDDAERQQRDKLRAFRAHQFMDVNAIAGDDIADISEEVFTQRLAAAREANEQRKAAIAKAASDRIAREAKIEADRIEAERLAEIERKEAKAKADAEEAARIAAAAPDAEKVAAYADAIATIDVPRLEGTAAWDRLNQLTADFTLALGDLADALKKGTV